MNAPGIDPWPLEESWTDELPDRDPFADTTREDPEIRAALDAAGYTYSAATAENLTECFLDYVAAGYWGDMDLEDARDEIREGTITVRDMIRALRR